MAVVTQSQFTSFLPSIKITVDATDYTLPIWNVSLVLEPWVGAGSPAQERPDGTFRQKVRGWHIKVDFDAFFSHEGTDACAATTAMEHAYNFGSLIIDFDPIDHVGKRVLTLVMVDGGGMSQASFSGRVRGRKFACSMITETKLATGAIPSWFAGDTV